MSKVPMRDKKEELMGKAIKQASIALQHNEVPIGAIIVNRQGVIIGRGYNKIEAHKCQMAHAEALAIKQACKKVGDWRLNGCTIYVSLEPCLMCIGLIQLSRIDRIVFGALSPLFGSSNIIQLAAAPSYAKQLQVESGVRERECIDLLQAFFKQTRKVRKGRRETES